MSTSLSLVVAQGVHEGKVIPIRSAQFLIGRDPECHLRPSSASVSKRHCGIFSKNGRVYVRDFGSTNGTSVNDSTITDEVELHDGDRLKAGPLDFIVRIQSTGPTKTPAPAKPAPVKKPARASDETVTDEPASKKSDAEDEIAAMLLDGDEGPAEVPEGTTVMELPALPPAGSATPGQPPGKDKVSSIKQQQADTSSAAEAILKKYMRRPRS